MRGETTGHHPASKASPENQEPRAPLLRCHFRVMMEPACGGLTTGQRSVSEMFLLPNHRAAVETGPSSWEPCPHASLGRREGPQRTRLQGAAVLAPDSLGTARGSGLPAEARFGVTGRLHPLRGSKLVQQRGAVTHRKKLSSPLKMGCDLLQSLPFGLRDTGQSEKDTKDAEGRGQPEGTVGPEHLLRRQGRGCEMTREPSWVRSPPGPRSRGPTPPHPGSGMWRRAWWAIQKPELSTVQACGWCAVGTLSSL